MLKRASACLGIAAIAIFRIHAQNAVTPPAFEVASIKPASPLGSGVAPGRLRQTPGGIDYRSASLYQLILTAYGIAGYQLSNPAGLSGQRWDIVAHSPANATADQFALMLQSLLADRFKLQVHRAPKELLAYMLVVAKGGAKLVEVPPPAGPLGGSALPSGGSRLKGRAPLSLLAVALSAHLQRPVIDMTAMPGIYDISFDYVPDEGERGAAVSAPVAGDGSVPVATLPGPSISYAIENALGLKLEARKVTVDMLIVDHVESVPTGN